MTATWCIVHTHSFKEAVAEKHLLEQGFNVYVPRFKKMRHHARKIDTVFSPLFPRYLFVDISSNLDQFHVIKNTRGVSYLLMGKDQRPLVVPTSIINDLKDREKNHENLPLSSLVSFHKGDRVVVNEGAFKDHLASIEALNDNGRIMVLLSFLGRETPVTLPLSAVKAA